MKRAKISITLITLALLLALASCDILSGAVSDVSGGGITPVSELSDPGGNGVSSSPVSGTDSADGTSSESIPSSAPVESSVPPVVSVDPESVRLINGILVAGNRGMEQYGGGVKGGAAYAGYLSELKKAVGAGINIYSMPIPIASYFYAPDGYKSSINNHEKTFNSIRENLFGVTDVNLLGALSAHAGEDIYSRTDTHWTALGAYYAAERLAQVAGVPFTDLSGFERKSFSDYVGSLYKYSGNNSFFTDNAEEFVYYVPKQTYTAKFYKIKTFTDPFESSVIFGGKSYSMFVGGDGYGVHIDTGVKNGRTLLVFKDSFGNALAPFLIGSFEHVYMLDIRAFGFDALDFIEEHGVTDICFALSAFSVVNANGARVKEMLP